MRCHESEHLSTREPEAPPSADASSPAAEVTRRSVLAAGLAGLAASVITAPRRSVAEDDGLEHLGRPIDDPHAPVEYIVIGSGAGGGPLACNLARAGHKVVLFEAGGGEADDVAGVPFFTGRTTEDPRIRWDYYVRHYARDEQQRRDPKFYDDPDPDRNGVWYPRVGALGGCTLHSRMIAVTPSETDWEHIEDLTGDRSWNPANMRKYFERLERCGYVRRLPGNPSRHGFEGWQPTEIPDLDTLMDDPKVLRILQAAAREVGDDAFSLPKLFSGKLDPNDWRVRNNREGLFNVPLFTGGGRRFGTRQFIRRTAAAFPNNLIVKTHCLVTRVLFEGRTAIGVEYLQGNHLYKADPNANTAPTAGTRKTMRVGREVILAAGTFNSPQLLKLSGIGPQDELADHDIATIVDLPGVGRNLQDRYEIGVVTDFKANFTHLAACTFTPPDDPCFAQWLQGEGPYTGFGVAGAILHKSATRRRQNRPDADLFIIPGLTQFTGYYHGYSIPGPDTPHRLTWIILKAHTGNRDGTVKLRSADPRDTPLINFHYFEEGTPGTGDLSAIVDGIELARRINGRITDLSNGDIIPGPQAQSRREIAQFVRNEAWGHHASCSCKIGPRSDPLAVVDSRFRVHGTHNLRVCDASVFPRIPGSYVRNVKTKAN
jgi:choline dehydrogenase